MERDWRTYTAQWIEGEKLQRRTWQQWTKDWDHDHCIGCGATFAEGSDHLQDGYTTTSAFRNGAGYEWVCPTCFSDLKDEMGWVEVPPEDKAIIGKKDAGTSEQIVSGMRLVGKE